MNTLMREQWRETRLVKTTTDWSAYVKTKIEMLASHFAVAMPYIEIYGYGSDEYDGMYVSSPKTIKIYRPGDQDSHLLLDTISHEFAHYLQDLHGGLDDEHGSTFWRWYRDVLDYMSEQMNLGITLPPIDRGRDDVVKTATAALAIVHSAADLVELARDMGALDGFKVIHNATLGHDELGSVCDALDLDGVTQAQVDAASRLIQQESQAALVRDGFPEVITVYRKGPLGYVVSVSTRPLGHFAPQQPYAVRREDVLTYGEGMQRGTFAEDELQVPGSKLRPMAPRTAAAQTVTFLHGTNEAAAELIRQHGFHAQDPEEVAHLIERRYGLPHDSVWKHSYNTFGHFRHGDLNIYFTQDPWVARSYAEEGSEVVGDCLSAASYLIENRFDEEGMFLPGQAEKRLAWVAEETRKHYRPVILHCEAPWDQFIEAYDKANPRRDRKVDFTSDWFTPGVEVSLPSERPHTITPWTTIMLQAPLPASWVKRVEVL